MWGRSLTEVDDGKQSQPENVTQPINCSRDITENFTSPQLIILNPNLLTPEPEPKQGPDPAPGLAPPPDWRWISESARSTTLRRVLIGRERGLHRCDGGSGRGGAFGFSLTQAAPSPVS